MCVCACVCVCVCVYVCVISGLVGLLGCLLTDMDEVAGSLGLAWDIRLEISVDAVLHFAAEGLLQQPLEALQTVRVVGQTEFTRKDKQSINRLISPQPNKECTF